MALSFDFLSKFDDINIILASKNLFEIKSLTNLSILSVDLLIIIIFSFSKNDLF